MKLLFDSFWRAAAYVLMPRVIGLSLLPLLLSGGLFFTLGYFFWETSVDAVRQTLSNWSLIEAAFKWLEGTVGASFRAVIAPLIVVALALPLIVVASLLLVAAFMTPSLVSLVAERRFPALERRRGGQWWKSLVWGLWWTLAALGALLLTMPLWLLPPLALLLPPLIWGWLTTQVMGYEVLAEHASVEERQSLLHTHRWPLLVVGVLSGMMGAAPTLIWAASATALIMAPMLIVGSVWLYTMVFAFSGLWFTHYALAALHQLRQAQTSATASAAQPVTPLAERLGAPAAAAAAGPGASLSSESQP